MVRASWLPLPYGSVPTACASPLRLSGGLSIPTNSHGHIGVRWMAKRWRHADKLSLIVPKLSNSARRDLAHAIMAAKPRATELMQVYLEWDDLDNEEPEEDIDPNANLRESERENAATCRVLLTWLTAHAMSVRSLCLCVYELHALPPLVNLRHLMLHFVCHPSAFPPLPVYSHLSLITGLQTLFMSGNNQAYSHTDLSVLTTLQHLRIVRLVDIAPSRISLLPEVALHAGVYTDSQAQRRV